MRVWCGGGGAAMGVFKCCAAALWGRQLPVPICCCLGEGVDGSDGLGWAAFAQAASRG